MADKWAQYAESNQGNQAQPDKWAQFAEAPAAQQMPQNPIPPNYGFSPGHMLQQGVQGLTQLGQGAYSLGKDVLQNPNWVSGPDSTLQKFVLGPAEQMKQKASTAKTTSESLGYSAAEAIPMLGPWAAGLGEQAGTGDVGGAAARGGAQVVAGAAVPKVLKAATGPIGRAAIKGAAMGAVEDIPVVGGAIKGYKAAAKVAGAEAPKPVYPGALLPEKPPTAVLKANRAVYPGAPLPATPAPEMLNPSLASEARTLPGQVGAERIFGPRPGTVTPIPSRTGLALPGKVETPSMTPVDTGNLPRSTGDPYAMKNTPSMESVQSSNLAKTGYHSDSNTMVVEYKNGRVYEYKGVPSKVYDQFKDAESQGSFVAQNVKGRYQTNYRGSVLGSGSKPSAAPAPQYAYRTRTVGEQGVPMTRGAASATSDLGQAKSYVQSRGDVESAPQEVVRVDLSKLKPEDYHSAQHPSGAQWYSFHKDIPESAIERVGSGSKQTKVSKLSN